MGTKNRLIFFGEGEQKLARAGFDTFCALYAAPGILVDRNRDRDVLRLAPFEEGEIPYLKRFHAPSAGTASMVAKREHRNILMFNERGFPGPTCCAMGIEGDGKENRSCLLFLAPQGVLPLEDYLLDAAKDEKRSLSSTLARLLAKIHGAGIRLPDLMARHVMVQPDGAPYFIDLARLRFRPWFPWRGIRSAMHDLARLSTTLPYPSVSAGDRLRFLQAYSAERTSSSPRRNARRLARCASGLERKQRKRRRFPVFFPIQENRSRGARTTWNARFSDDVKALGFTGQGDFLSPPRGARLLRDVGDRKNYRLTLEDRIFYLKVHRENPKKGATSKGRKEWENHLRLMSAGIPVPDPVSWGQGPGYSFFMSRGCSGPVFDAPALRWENKGPANRRRLIAVLAHRIARMHRFGYFHRDLYLCHIVVEGEEVVIIDLQRLEDGPRFAGFRRVKDLAALLYASWSGPFSRTERLRFFRIYQGGGKIDAKGKRLLDAVESKARRIQARENRKRTILRERSDP